MQPDARLLAAAGELRHGVDRGRAGRPDGRDDGSCVVEREVGAHAELVVHGHLAELEPDEPRRLLDAEVRLLGRVDHASGLRVRAAASAAIVAVDAVSSM